MCYYLNVHFQGQRVKIYCSVRHWPHALLAVFRATGNVLDSRFFISGYVISWTTLKSFYYNSNFLNVQRKTFTLPKFSSWTLNTTEYLDIFMPTLLKHHYLMCMYSMENCECPHSACKFQTYDAISLGSKLERASNFYCLALVHDNIHSLPFHIPHAVQQSRALSMRCSCAP